MTAQVPQVMDRDAPIFAIGVAAHLAGMHPQTLRGYDKLGLVQPQRARGRGRRYSLRDVQRLRLIQHLSQTEGINLTGIQRILDMEAEIERLRAAVQRVSAQRDELAQQLATGGRVFTAETSGAVHLGRVIHGQRALPGR
jgi:MerR family transcriptional regulator, heat shock protein HspR